MEEDKKRDNIRCECGAVIGLYLSKRLNRWICPSCFEKSIEPNPTVWILTVGHKHGEDTSVHSTEAFAYDALHDYVVEWWDEIEEHVKVPDDWYDSPDGDIYIPDDHRAAINLYFEIQREHKDCQEWADIEQHRIDGPVPD